MSAEIFGLTDVDPVVLADFLALRKAKKAPLTATAVKGLRCEAAKAGMALDAVLSLCCERGWAGFQAAWLDKSGPVVAAGPVRAPAESFREKDTRLAREQWERMTGRVHPESPKNTALVVVDAVEIDQTRELQ